MRWGQDEKLDEELSDISDNSDLFHVDVSPSEQPRTPEDEELALIRVLAHHIRARPLLPPHPDDAARDFLDVGSGVRLPTVHCASKGC